MSHMGHIVPFLQEDSNFKNRGCPQSVLVRFVIL